jgi:hypothetical protein
MELDGPQHKPKGGHEVSGRSPVGNLVVQVAPRVQGGGALVHTGYTCGWRWAGHDGPERSPPVDNRFYATKREERPRRLAVW